jgi:PAS domain S-box-containing protein
MMNHLLRTRHNLRARYVVALSLACLALLLRGLIPIRPGMAIYQLPLAAVVVSAWYGGRGPGLLAFSVSVAGLVYWFIPPADSFALPGEYAVSLTLFLANSILLIEFSAGRRRTEQALEESEGRFRLTAETVPELLWIESLEPRKVLYLSPSYDRIWGRPANDLDGTRDWRLDAIHPEDRPYVSSTLTRWLAGENQDRYDLEYRIIRPDGATRWIHDRGTLIKDKHEKPYRASGVAEDITEAKSSQEALDNAQAELAHVTRVSMLGEMSASIAHEINQPLGAIVNNAGACLGWLDAGNLEEARNSVGLVMDDAQRAGEIITRTRALVKKAPPQKDWLDINQIIREVIALGQSEVQRNHIALETQLSEDVAVVFADRIQLQQVMLNLMMNAIEAMSQVTGPRELLISSGADDAKDVVVVVRDSGPGLDSKTLERLFEPFYTTKPQGMGMGLAICRSLIEVHGGRLWAAANTPHGAVFQFTLPIGSEKV